MYKVIRMFRDLADYGHLYQPGDTFPRSGFVADAERLNQLATNDNLRGKPLIEAVEAPKQAAEDKAKETDTTTKKSAQRPRRSRKKE